MTNGPLVKNRGDASTWCTSNINTAEFGHNPSFGEPYARNLTDKVRALHSCHTRRHTPVFRRLKIEGEFMPRLGLKLGVHETSLADPAKRLWGEGKFDFLELYISADAQAADCMQWEWYDGLLCLHAPHSSGGFNFSRKDMDKSNRQNLETIESIRELLSPSMVVFHPGVDGEAAETVRQITAMRHSYPKLHRVMLLENKPGVGSRGECCLGASPVNVREIIESVDCGFCMDIRHAFAYAAGAGRAWREVMEEFTGLEPRLWHAADGEVSAVFDSHDHFGKGNMPWSELAAFFREGTLVTIECQKKPSLLLEDFIEDARRLRLMLSCSALALRHATSDDCRLLWKWANDSSTRSNSYNSDSIPLSSHRDWFSRTLADPTRIVFICENKEKKPVGSIRFNELQKEVWETSICVDFDFRGFGIGTRLVTLAAKDMFNNRIAKRLHAWVRADNFISRQMFTRAGFSLAAENVLHQGCASHLLVLVRQ